MASTVTRPRLVDKATAADYLGVTERWIVRAVAERRIPFKKLGRLLRFDLDELDKWVDAQSRPPRAN